MTAPGVFTAVLPKGIIEDPAFTKWEEDLDGSLLVRVQAARDKIESDGIITSAKDLGDGLYEKKWNSGLRLYFAVVDEGGKRTLLLLRSGKGRAQARAIRESRKNLKNYKVVSLSLVK